MLLAEERSEVHPPTQSHIALDIANFLSDDVSRFDMADTIKTVMGSLRQCGACGLGWARLERGFEGMTLNLGPAGRWWPSVMDKGIIIPSYTTPYHIYMLHFNCFIPYHTLPQFIIPYHSLATNCTPSWINVYHTWCGKYGWGKYGVVWIIGQCRMSQGYKEGNELALSVKRHHPNHQSLEQLSPNHHQNHYYQINDIRDACSTVDITDFHRSCLV